MPILEAKAVGVPVVTSAIAPMNEVGKDYAFLADPDEPESIKKSLIEALESKTNAQCDVSLLANSKAAAQRYKSLYSKIHSEI